MAAVDRAALIEAAAKALDNCCDECAVDPDGAAMKDAKDMLSAVLPLVAQAIEAQYRLPGFVSRDWRDATACAARLVRSLAEEGQTK